MNIVHVHLGVVHDEDRHIYLIGVWKNHQFSTFLKGAWNTEEEAVQRIHQLQRKAKRHPMFVEGTS